MNGDDPVEKSDKLDEQIAALPVHSIFTRRQIVVSWLVILVVLAVGFTVMFFQLRGATHSAAAQEQATSTCRFAASTEVNSIADNIDALTADIFVEAIIHPVPPGTVNPRLLPLADQIAEQIRKLRPAIVAREKAVTECGE